MHWMYGFDGGWFMMILWWIIIIAVVIVLIRWLSVQRTQPPHEDSALEVLNKRYARGEISKEEFEEKRNAILH